MLWVTICLLALLVGIAMFARLQPDLPPELGFLKSEQTSSQVATQDELAAGANGGALPSYGEAAGGWKLQVAGEGRELSKDFNEAISAPGGHTYDKPSLYLTCYQGALYARINTRIRVSGERPIQLDLPKTPAWKEAEQQNWYSTNAMALAASLAARGSVQARLNFAEAGEQRFTLNTSGLARAAKQLAPCRF